MQTVTISIRETSPNVWRLTHDGRVLGDSRGYRKDQAIAKARERVASNAYHRTQGDTDLCYQLGDIP